MNWLETMPAWLQNIMKFTPNTQFVDFSQAVLYRSVGIGTVWPQLLALPGIGAGLCAIALVRFR